MSKNEYGLVVEISTVIKEVSILIYRATPIDLHQFAVVKSVA